MSLYSDLQGVATDLFEQFRQGDSPDSLTYIEVTRAIGGTDANPGQPNETSHPIAGTTRNAQFKYVDGKTILATDLQISFGVQPFTPKVTDFFEMDGKRFNIAAVKPVPATGPVIAHVIFIRA